MQSSKNSGNISYVVDYFNVFSDYREVYYKNNSKDFHETKYKTIKQDTESFFDVFFTLYLQKMNIDANQSNFIFIIKKIYNYEEILASILEKYKYVHIRFVLVYEKYNDKLIEKNKDDFICQYLIAVFNTNTILISNDNYKDKLMYTSAFLTNSRINIQVLQYQTSTKTITRSSTFLIIDETIINKIISRKITRKNMKKEQFALLV